MKFIKISDLLVEAKDYKTDIKKTPALIKHCTVAVYKNKKFRPRFGNSKAYGAMNMCRHVMSQPWHHHKDGLSAFYKRGSHKGKTSGMKRTLRGVRRDFKHAFERGGARKTSYFNILGKRFEPEYIKHLKKYKQYDDPDEKSKSKSSPKVTGTKQGKAKTTIKKSKETGKKKEKSPLRKSTKNRIERF